MRCEENRIKEAGARIVFVGSGTPQQAKEFSRGCGELPVYSDARRQSYGVAGFRRSWLRTMSPRVGWHFFKSIFGGFRPTGVKGDPIQQGGILLLAPPGKLLYRYEAKHAADHPPLDEVLAALK